MDMREANQPYIAFASLLNNSRNFGERLLEFGARVCRIYVCVPHSCHKYVIYGFVVESCGGITKTQDPRAGCDWCETIGGTKHTGEAISANLPDHIIIPHNHKSKVTSNNNETSAISKFPRSSCPEQHWNMPPSSIELRGSSRDLQKCNWGHEINC